MSGAQAQALNYYDSKIMPYNHISLTVGEYFQAVMRLDFGRFLYDPDYALVPSKFSNLQLKITWDEDACNGSVVVNSLSIYAHVDDAPAKQPIGYLMSKEHYQYAMAASSHKYIDLPTDYNIRKMLLRGLSTDHDPVLLFNNLKLSIDNDKFIPFDILAERFYQMMKAQWPVISEAVVLDGVVTAKTIYANISRDQLLIIQQDDTAVTAAGEVQAVSWTGAVAALSTGVAVQSDFALIQGTLPHNCIEVPFEVNNDPESSLKAPAYGSVELDLLSSSDADSGDTASIVLQQYRPY